MRNIQWFLLTLIVSFLIKLCFAWVGDTYDIESYKIVAKIVDRGGSFYADTHRYNYGPIWAYITWGCWRLANFFGPEGTYLHLIITFLLSIVDGIISNTLRQLNRVAGYLFLLNPISWVVSGYYAQFDNLAILLGLLGCLLLVYKPQKIVIASLIIGISLTTKHVLAFLPIWFFLQKSNYTFKERISLLIIPYGFFILSFIPYAIEKQSFEGIKTNVFEYSSFHGYSLFSTFLKATKLFNISEILFKYIPIFKGAKFVWLMGMIVVGLFFRNENNRIRLYFIYLIALVCFTTAMADEFLVIPIAACCYFYKTWSSRFYVLIASIYLVLIAPLGLHSVHNYEHPFLPRYSYGTIQCFLYILLFCLFYKSWVKQLTNKRGAQSN